MADGIEQSAVVVVFITQTYIDKVNQGNSQDNCYMSLVSQTDAWVRRI